MPRKTKEETERTRKKILDVALDVFAEKGYSHTSLKEIADRAGFTRGAVYWHFENKADLFEALADDVEGGAFAGPEDFRAIGSLGELQAILCSYLARLENDERYGTFCRVVEYRTEWVEELAPLVEKNRRELRALADWMVGALRHLAELGKIESRDPEKDGLALYIHVMGIYTIWMTDPEFLSMIRDAPAHIERFLDGLAPGSSREKTS